MIAFELPSLGADMDEGTLLEWKVAPGEHVVRGQVVAVVDTSKAAVDVEIWRDGVVAELRVQPGEKVPVGTVLATLLEPGETGACVVGEASRKPVAAAPQSAPMPAAPVDTGPREPMASLPGRELAAATRRPVSPAARKRARELGLDPDRLEAGTGPHGSVTIADVERAAAVAAATPASAPKAVSAEAARSVPEPSTAPTPEPASLPASAPASARDLALARQKEMRRAIAAAMSRSKREIPHYYLSETIPMARALAWLQEANAARPITERLLPAVLQLKAVALALARVPELNGFQRDGSFTPSEAVHTGVAISLRGGGLVAPALHDVGAKPLEQLMRELTDLVRRARAGSLRSSEMSDPTITVTNLGDQGCEAVFPIIYPPQVAIVGFGRIVERPWAQDGWVRAIPVVTASLAADHRVSDGHRGALFLTELADWLQRPVDIASAG